MNLIERLRHFADKCGNIMEREAADRIEALEAALREANYALTDIAWMRGVNERSNQLIERMERVALDASDNITNLLEK